MRTLVGLLVLGLLLVVVMIQPAVAGDVSGATVPQAGMSAASAAPLPLLFAQSSDSSSSGGSTRIPRGLIRLAIFGVIALFSAGAWVVRQMTGSS